MQVFLIAAAQAEAAHYDANTMPLTEAGREQARRLAAFCAEQGVQFLCASAMARAQQTADAIHASLPSLVRWDLEELEEMSMEDLLYDPSVGPLVNAWTPEQRLRGLERVWVRLMAVWARVQLYAQNNALERVALVGHRYTTMLFLLHFLGLDWTAYPALDLAVEPGALSHITLDDAGRVRVGYINRLV